MSHPDLSGLKDNSSILENAVKIASDGCNEIDLILKDIRIGDGTAAYPGDANELGDDGTGVANVVDTGRDVCDKYYGAGAIDSDGISINSAAGAMVIDDLMQKISTKVQVAAQLLSTANNMAKKVMQSLIS